MTTKNRSKEVSMYKIHKIKNVVDLFDIREDSYSRYLSLQPLTKENLSSSVGLGQLVNVEDKQGTEVTKMNEANLTAVLMIEHLQKKTLADENKALKQLQKIMEKELGLAATRQQQTQSALQAANSEVKQLRNTVEQKNKTLDENRSNHESIIQEINDRLLARDKKIEALQETIKAQQEEIRKLTERT